MTGKKYRIFENVDEEYSLKPITFGLYEKIKLSQLRCTIFDQESKDAIMKEFNVQEPAEEEKIGIKEMYEIYVKELFFDVPEFEINDVRIDEVNKAIRDFFTRAAG